MNLADITTKCYILALIIRDDGERLLLGDGAYEFKDSQQHFIANTYANDVVELQGTDGQMLAGQVRRTATQTFAGYIGDATFSKQKVEEARRDFLMFFRKKHYYTAVYVFSDGTAIQRDRGYIVNAPSVPELYQRFPEWSVGLNFEDPNYYEYAEDDLGQEIAAHKVELELSTAMSGGLIWDEDGAVSDDLSYVGTEIPGEGKNFQLADTGTATLKSAELLGDATQDETPTPDAPQAVNIVTGEQTVGVTGKNLFDRANAIPNTGLAWATGATFAENKSISSDFMIGSAGMTFSSNFRMVVFCYDSNKSYLGALQTGQDTLGTTGGGNFTTFTLPDGFGITFIKLAYRTSLNNSVDMTAQDIMVNIGSTATTYEPYQGQEFPIGLASKNLASLETSATKTVGGLPFTTDGGIISINGRATGDNFYFDTFRTPSGSATLSAIITGYTDKASNNSDISIQQSTDGTTWTQLGGISFLSTQPKTRSVTLEANKLYRVRMFISGGSVFTNATIKLQLELGTQATQFAPYFTLIELAKIGNYQDRIYKSDGKWYIEKQVGKVVLDGSEAWTATGGGNGYRIEKADIVLTPANTNAPILSDYFTTATFSSIYNATIDYGIANHNSNHWIVLRDKNWTSASDVTTWLASNPTTVYYALATPVDEEITSSELVGQLERLRHSHTYADTTNFSITATSPNLPAFLKVVAFGDDAIPQGGYVWEDGGTGGATTITVDGVDNAQPIWTVVGPATNPSLTNITTGESIQWTGVVPNGQTLVVNMADMTASLSGANVFEFISGSWITLQAGNNRVSYSATAATGIATLEWNGVVG